MEPEIRSHINHRRRQASQATAVAMSALGLVIALPFLSNLHLTYSWSYPKLFALQTAVLITWAGLFIVRPAGIDELLTASGVGLPMTLILAWAALTTTWSNAPWAAMQPFVELTTMALAVVGFANLLTEARTRRWFTAAYGFAAGGACLVYVLCHTWAESHMRVYPFDNPNVAAAFAIVPMAAGAAYAISAGLGRIEKRPGVVGGLIAAACAAAILASGSSAAMISAAGAMLLVVVFSCRGRLRRLLLEVAGVLAVVALLWPLMAPGLWPAGFVKKQLGARPAMWQGAVRLAHTQPAWGLGLGSFFVEYTSVYPWAYAAHPLRSDIVESAHCLPLHVVAELGLVGLVLAGWLIFRAFRNAKIASGKANHKERALLRGLVCGGLGMLAQGLVSTVLHQPECSINLVLALAMIGGMANFWWRRPTPAAKPHLSLRIIPVVLLAAIYVLTAGTGLLSQVYLRRGSTTPPQHVKKRIERLEKAVSTGWPTLWRLRAREKLALAYYRDDRYESALDQLLAIDHLAPNIAGVKRNEAVLCLRLGYLAQGARAIASYCRKDPFDILAYKIWIRILEKATQQGRPHVARPEQALELLAVAQQYDTKRLTPAQARRLSQPFLHAAAR